MSEYQYYEFKSIDKALTETQIASLHKLSSRAEVSSHRAIFIYHYGDFRGNVEQLMRTSFDAMVYLANWGDRRLIFRLPTHLIDTSEWREFFISEAIEKTLCSDNKNFILGFNFFDEEANDWTDGEGWLDDLQSLRDDIIAGDFRVLYLAWLKACQLLTKMEDIKDDILEPPIPAGLNKLNPALEQFIRYVELDPQLVNAAAKNSAKLTVKTQNPASLIRLLSTQEQQHFLIKLSNNEANLSASLNKRLHELDQSAPALSATNTEIRSFQKLAEIADNLTVKAEKQALEKAKKDRENELRLLSGKQEMTWQAVDDCIEQKNASGYDEAHKHLINLRDLAEFEKRGAVFNQRLSNLKKIYSRRSSLQERFNRIDLL